MRKPVSPPKKRPPALKKRYVAISPKVVGFRRGVMFGIASIYAPEVSSSGMIDVNLLYAAPLWVSH